MGTVGGFLLVVGVSITGLWMVLLATDQVPEIAEGRTDIWFHLAAEWLTAGVLIAAGVAVLRRTVRSSLLAGVALGALGYTVVNSAGYYAEAGDWPPVGMFGVLMAATVLAGLRLFRSTRPDVEPAAGEAHRLEGDGHPQVGTPATDAQGTLPPGGRP